MFSCLPRLIPAKCQEVSVLVEGCSCFYMCLVMNDLFPPWARELVAMTPPPSPAVTRACWTCPAPWTVRTSAKSMVPATTDKFQTWADIPCLSVTSIKQIIGSERMQPDSFIPFYMFVSYTFFFFFCISFFSIYTVLFGSGAHPAFCSSGTVGFSPRLKNLIRSLTFRGLCIVIYSYNKANEVY